jgi:hypothetical protein
MKLCARLAITCAVTAALGHGAAGTLHAQDAPRYQQVISANPFGLLLEWFNAEYERAVGQTVTAGVGGSYISASDSESDDRYLNGDFFVRYYPQGHPFDGWAFGVKAGITSVREGFVGSQDAETNTFFGFGFDVNRSWLLGANDNFYVGVGLGLKRLLGAGDRDFDFKFVPTIRLVNIGFAF